ncbi:MAG: hypothetical protein WDO14_07205 [Bacteroidota bacterium]
MKVLKYVLIAFSILFVLWLVGLFAGLKVTPVFEEDYYVGEAGLSDKIVLMEKGEELLLEIPHDSDSLKSIDILVFPNEGKHRITVNDISVKVIADGKTLDTVYYYVFSSFGEHKDAQSIKDFPVGLTDDDSVSTYVLFRSVYVLYNVDDFKLDVNADYVYDGEVRKYSRVFDVEHTRKLRWRGLRLPGGDH